MSENQAYISKVHLKGYKSIKDLEIDINPGLNIVIGANGSGKTNFVEFFNTIITDIKTLYPNEFEGIIKLKHKSEIYTEYYKGYFDENHKSGNPVFVINDKVFNGKELKFNWNLLIGIDEMSQLDSNEEPEIDNINAEDINAFSILTPVKYLTFINPFKLSLFNNIKIQFTVGKKTKKILSTFPDDFNTNFYSYFRKKLIAFEDIADFISSNPFDEQFVNYLNKYTPIKDIRIQNELIRQYEDNGKIILDNIFIQFKVNDKWLYWEQLSDGTRRLFYIFFSMLNSNSKFIFLEEPELGIHPHQLSRLMDFLREQSRSKQIIITTHSPQVLNELKEDELDRIIVTRYEGAERGTQMYHLSEEEKNYALDYMKNGAFLSDYWVQSGFMKEEEGIL